MDRRQRKTRTAIFNAFTELLSNKDFNQIKIRHKALFYSVLNAVTGSFLAAVFEGMIPPISVRTTLKITSTIAPSTGNTALIS